MDEEQEPHQRVQDNEICRGDVAISVLLVLCGRGVLLLLVSHRRAIYLGLSSTGLQLAIPSVDERHQVLLLHGARCLPSSAGVDGGGSLGCRGDDPASSGNHRCHDVVVDLWVLSIRRGRPLDSRLR